MTDHDLIQEARQWTPGMTADYSWRLAGRLADALEAAAARIDQLQKALRRLASQEGFEGAGWVGGDSFAERELLARGRFAEEAIAGVPAEHAEEKP